MSIYDHLITVSVVISSQKNRSVLRMSSEIGEFLVVSHSNPRKTLLSADRGLAMNRTSAQCGESPNASGNSRRNMAAEHLGLTQEPIFWSPKMIYSDL